ncbi:MAG: hypothetical protein WCB11_02975 [Terriglobales bacterium]
MYDRSYIVKRIEKGKPDVTTNFPEDAGAAVLDYALEWCRSDGYKIIEHKRVETPNDERFIATITVIVESKPKPQICPHCQKPGMVEVVDGDTYYAHKQTVEFGKDTVNFGFKYCPEPPKVKAKAGD